MQKKTVEELDRISVERFKTTEKTPLTVVLDNIRSLHNVGSVFRTSDAYLIEDIILCGITATPPAPEIHKTALGAENSVTWHHFEKTKDAIADLKKKGYTIFAVEQVQGSLLLENITLEKSKRYAVVFGNEVKGVEQDAVNLCDNCIELPQYGTKHSLNVSVTAGIVIWEFFKQLRF